MIDDQERGPHAERPVQLGDAARVARQAHGTAEAAAARAVQARRVGVPLVGAAARGSLRRVQPIQRVLRCVVLKDTSPLDLRNTGEDERTKTKKRVQKHDETPLSEKNLANHGKRDALNENERYLSTENGAHHAHADTRGSPYLRRASVLHVQHLRRPTVRRLLALHVRAARVAGRSLVRQPIDRQ